MKFTRLVRSGALPGTDYVGPYFGRATSRFCHHERRRCGNEILRNEVEHSLLLLSNALQRHHGDSAVKTRSVAILIAGMTAVFFSNLNTADALRAPSRQRQRTSHTLTVRPGLLSDGTARRSADHASPTRQTSKSSRLLQLATRTQIGLQEAGRIASQTFHALVPNSKARTALKVVVVLAVSAVVMEDCGGGGGKLIPIPVRN